jgi:tRNA threonylcarbamoyladenosine biosynthesis protein TsaB
MILLLDTSTPLCKLTLVEGTTRHDHEWQADRTLAQHLLGYLSDTMKQYGWSWTDIEGIGVFQGPGSFTGLRIGMSVLNTIADANAVAIVGSSADDWQSDAIKRLQSGDNDQMVLPLYGSDATITKPRK